MPTPFRLWILDDRPENSGMVLRSIPPESRALMEIECFVQAQACLDAFALRLRTSPATLPDCLLLDFFLDRTYGHKVLDTLRQLQRSAGGPLLVVVAHSSMAEANRLLLKHGADFSLEKRKGQPTSPPIAALFRSPAALQWLCEQRTPLPDAE